MEIPRFELTGRDPPWLEKPTERKVVVCKQHHSSIDDTWYYHEDDYKRMMELTGDRKMCPICVNKLLVLQTQYPYDIALKILRDHKPSF
jgi:hypothetical protein